MIWTDESHRVIRGEVSEHLTRKGMTALGVLVAALALFSIGLWECILWHPPVSPAGVCGDFRSECHR